MMTYLTAYRSPLGQMTLAAEDDALSGVWFDGQKYDRANIGAAVTERECPVLTETKHWLDLYFQGIKPDFTPKLYLYGTDFQMAVWDILKEIPYGRVMTYGEIAAKIAKDRGLLRMSAQAVGGAVGHNPISILVPCHRVVGSNGSLTGYAGGIHRKIRLLGIEQVDLTGCKAACVHEYAAKQSANDRFTQ